MNLSVFPLTGKYIFVYLLVLGFLSFLLSVILFIFPEAAIAQYVLPLGLAILAVSLLSWRTFYEWTLHKPMFMERVYVLGGGEYAQAVIQTIQNRRDGGMEVVGNSSTSPEKSARREAYIEALNTFPGP